MDRYTEYKDSGVRWIGKIPVHWRTASLKRMVSLVKDKTTDSKEPYIALEHIESYSGRLLPLSGIEPESSCYRFRQGDILFCKLRPYLTKCVIPDFAGKCSSELLVLRGFKGYSKYLQYVLLSPKYISDVNASTYGAKMPRANWSYISTLPIPIPSSEEQQKIASYLDFQLAKIQSYIAERERELSLLETLKKTEIAQVVTKGLNPDVPMKDSGLTWIGEIPAHWEVKRISTIYIENKQSNRLLKYTKVFQYSYGSLVEKSRRYVPEEDNKTYSKYTIIAPGDIVINGLNLNYDFVSQRVAISNEKGIITSSYVCLTPRPKSNSQYFCFLFKAMDSMKLFHGMGSGIRLTLSFEELKKQLVPIPPPNEQQAIVDYIEGRISQIDSYITAINEELEQLRQYKQLLISDAVTGKIKVFNE